MSQALWSKQYCFICGAEVNTIAALIPEFVRCPEHTEQIRYSARQFAERQRQLEKDMADNYSNFASDQAEKAMRLRWGAPR